MALLVDRLLESVARYPARAAFIASGGVVTYRQLLALWSNAARLLHQRGVRAGDVVALWMGQSPLHVVAFLALARLGAVALPVFPNLRFADRLEALRRYGARMVITDAASLDAGGIPLIALTQLDARGDECDFSFTDFAPVPDAPLRLALTSGTTARQKAVLHTHGQFTSRLDRRFYTETDCPRMIPPVLHITDALQFACHALSKGGAAVFPARDDLAGLLQAIHQHAVTHVMTPAAELASMLLLLPEETPAFPSIVQLRVVGTTPSRALVDLARRKFSPHVTSVYALTETGVVAVSGTELLLAHPGCAGRVAPGARVEVVDGVIRVMVDGMPRGYYGPDASLPGFVDGWFDTGDRGRVTADGLVWIEGRDDGIINVGGYKVAPEHVEAILSDHPNVQEIAAFPLEEGIDGTRIGAAVVARDALDWRALAKYARTALGAIAPVRYFEVGRLPRNPMGKIVRARLAEWAAENGRLID